MFDGTLQVYSKHEFTYRLRGVHVRVSVQWNFEAPPGTGDTHYSAGGIDAAPFELALQRISLR